MTLLPSTHQRRDRADGNDVAPFPVDGFLRRHLVGDRLNEEESAVQVDILDSTPKVSGEGEEGMKGADSGVGD